MQFTDINWSEIWQETMGWNTSDKSGRKFDDIAEREFWENLAPTYTKVYNLNNDTGLVAERLAELLGENNSILEIGCGSGNFTVLMARYSRKILGVDFSSAMLQELKCRLLDNDIRNVHTVNSKWEDFTSKESFDYIVSVNSLYRVFDMQTALTKMNFYSNKGIILIRTIQRPFFYSLYKKMGICCNECLDYQLLPIMLWQQGLQANVDFLHYEKAKVFSNETVLEEEMLDDLGTDVFAEYRNTLLQHVLQKAENSKGGLLVKMPRTTVIINVKK